MGRGVAEQETLCSAFGFPASGRHLAPGTEKPLPRNIPSQDLCIQYSTYSLCMCCVFICFVLLHTSYYCYDLSLHLNSPVNVTILLQKHCHMDTAGNPHELSNLIVNIPSLGMKGQSPEKLRDFPKATQLAGGGSQVSHF